MGSRHAEPFRRFCSGLEFLGSRIALAAWKVK
jgi:hypothetical protein